MCGTAARLWFPVLAGAAVPHIKHFAYPQLKISEKNHDASAAISQHPQPAVDRQEFASRDSGGRFGRIGRHRVWLHDKKGPRSSAQEGNRDVAKP